MTASGPPGGGDEPPPSAPTQPDPVPRSGPGTTDEHKEPQVAPPSLEEVFPALTVRRQLRLQGGQARGLYRCTVDGDSPPDGWPSEVFVKVYPAGPQLEQIWQAWRAAAREPGITRLLAARSVDNWAYEVTPYHLRRSLHDRLTGQPENPPDLAEVERVVAQVAQALTVLHELRVDGLRLVHRDIKPANLLLVDLDQPTVEITDFGVARLQQLPFDRAPFVGSFEYAPPEALGAGTVAQGWDWWSLGITVLELVQGHHPLQDAYGHRYGRDDFAAMIMGGPVPIPDTLPARWQRLVRGLLAMADTRWSGPEVLDWLAGEEIPPAEEAADDAGTTGATRPAEQAWRESRPAFPYAGALYDDPVALAGALCADWSGAVRTVIAGARWADLQSWATAWRAELGAAVEEVQRGFVTPRRHPDRSLAELLIRLDPGITPRFRGHQVDLPGLNRLTATALDDVRGADDPVKAEALDTIEQLRVSGALVAFAALREHAELAGVDENWQRWWTAARRALDRIRPLASGLDLDAEVTDGELTALLLQCAVSPDAVAELAVLARASVTRSTRRIPWLAELQRAESRHDRPARDALVILLAPLAVASDDGRRWPGWRRPPREQAGTGVAGEPPTETLPGRQTLPGQLPLPTPGTLPGVVPLPAAVSVPALAPVPSLVPVPPAGTVPTPGPVPAPHPLPTPGALPSPDPLPPPRSHPPRPRSRS